LQLGLFAADRVNPPPADTLCRFRKRRRFDHIYPNANPLAIDFLAKTLTCEWRTPSLRMAHTEHSASRIAHRAPLTRPVDPRKRLTVEQCLSHPYLDAYHDPEDEPSCPPLDPSFFDFDDRGEDDKLSRQELKRLL
jgi:mitogen-activated protein kinase 1/3